MASNDTNRSCIKTRFRRYECKYVVAENIAERIRGAISPYVVPDPHAAASPDHSYDITSLYLDSPDLRLFRETEDGVANRIKLRIRSYGEAGDTPVFLEIKRRCNRLVLKARARIPRAMVASILAGRAPGPVFRELDQGACYDEFLGWVARWFAQPTMWVTYRREAYVGTYNDDVRITMDRRLRCAPAVGQPGAVRTSDWRPIETRLVVLELKFDESYPDWMARLVQRFQLDRRSYSKYGNAVRCGLDPWLLSTASALLLPSN